MYKDRKEGIGTMNALAQIETHYSDLVNLHAPIYNVAGKKHWQPNPDVT